MGEVFKGWRWKIDPKAWSLLSVVYGFVIGIASWNACTGTPPPPKALDPFYGPFAERLLPILFVAGISTGMLWKRHWLAGVGVFCGQYACWCYVCSVFPRETSGPQIFPVVMHIPLRLLISFWPGCLVGHFAGRFLAWLLHPDGARHFVAWLLRREGES